MHPAATRPCRNRRSSGYRAQYYISVENGERFNRFVIKTIAPLIVEATGLYKDKFSRELCKLSLYGKYSKFWFANDITDPSGQEYLNRLPEVIRVKSWREYWEDKQPPRKGLLAPLPKCTVILLNGTFVNLETKEICNQKPGRSRELYEQGWT